MSVNYNKLAVSAMLAASSLNRFGRSLSFTLRKPEAASAATDQGRRNRLQREGEAKLLAADEKRQRKNAKRLRVVGGE